jgi:hypothetical protein
MWMAIVLISLLQACTGNVRGEYKLPVTVSELIETAQLQIPKLDYESKAIHLLDMYRAKASQTWDQRKGYLCTTFIKWSEASQRLLFQNMVHSKGFCDWLIIVYNAANKSETQITDSVMGHMAMEERFNAESSSPLANRLNLTTHQLPGARAFQIVVLPSKKEIPAAEKILCEEYMHQNEKYLDNSTKYPRKAPVYASPFQSLLENDRYFSPCQFIQDIHHDQRVVGEEETPYNAFLYSKVEMLQYLLPYLSQYRYAWVLDGDLSLSALDMLWFAKIHQCSLFQSPIVAQPLIHENTQSYRYLQRRSWENPRILASNVGFIEIQAPLMDAMFLEWYIMAFIVPLSPALHILGVDWGYDEMFCTAAAEFMNRIGVKGKHQVKPYNKFNTCAAIISDMSINHRNLGEIGSVFGKDTKLRLNFGLMKIVHQFFKSFAHNGLQPQMDPLHVNGTVEYLKVRSFAPNCKLV